MSINLRSNEPPVVIPEKITIPPAEKLLLPGDIPICIIRQGTQEVVKVELVFTAGNITSMQPLLATAANDLMDEGTARHSSQELAEALDYYGAYLQLESGADWSSVSLFSLEKFTAQTLPYLFEILTEPSYPESEIETFRSQGKQRLAVNMTKTDFLARRNFINALYGDSHPYGRLSESSHYDSINTQSLLGFHIDHYRKGLCGIIISGQFSDHTLKLVTDAAGKAGLMKGKLPEINADLPGPVRKHVLKKDAIQSAIRIGRRLFNRKHPDFFDFQVMNTVLGGYFGSRLMSNIREDKGYTYGIGSGLVSNAFDGYFFIATEVGADVKDLALKEIYFEVDRLRDELVSIEELEIVKNYMTGAFQRSIDGPFSLADRHKLLILNNLDINYFDNYIQAIRNAGPEKIRECARKYLTLTDLTEVVAGP